AAVLRLRADVVVAEASEAVGVLLEVPRSGVEPMRVEDIVDDVVPVKEVRDRGVTRIKRTPSQIKWEVEVEARGSIGIGPHVGGVVVVTVRVGMDVVALRSSEVGAGDTVDVVPAER